MDESFQALTKELALIPAPPRPPVSTLPPALEILATHPDRPAILHQIQSGVPLSQIYAAFSGANGLACTLQELAQLRNQALPQMLAARRARLAGLQIARDRLNHLAEQEILRGLSRTTAAFEALPAGEEPSRGLFMAHQKYIAHAMQMISQLAEDEQRIGETDLANRARAGVVKLQIASKEKIAMAAIEARIADGEGDAFSPNNLPASQRFGAIAGAVGGAAGAIAGAAAGAGMVAGLIQDSRSAGGQRQTHVLPMREVERVEDCVSVPRLPAGVMEQLG